MKKKNNYFLAQTLDEIYYLEKNNKNNAICIPLNLEQLLYCKEKKIKHINPKDFLNNEFHQKSIKISNQIAKSCKIKTNLDYNFQIEFISILRFRINLIIFILEVLNSLDKRFGVSKLFLSGWYEENPSSVNYYFLYRLEPVLKNLYKTKILNKKKINKKIKIFNYKIKNLKLKGNKNILLSNLGYNFSRFIFSNINQKYNYYFFANQKISFIKKIIFRLLNLIPIYIEKIPKKNYKINNIDFKLNTKNIPSLKECLTELMNDYKIYFTDLTFYQKEIENFISNNKLALVITNIIKGVDGTYSNVASKYKIPTLCVSHGTVSKGFNQYDKIYKQTIAESVFSGKCSYFAVQSKICRDSLKTHRIGGKPLYSGNLIFSENYFSKKNKKKYALYAVTLKDISSCQVYGVDMFYEFNSNLAKLDNIAKNGGYKIVVKIHPGQIHCVSYLKNYYRNLDFKNDKIDSLLKKSYALISFSSTAIEDALNCQIPVILLDPWKRYQHCDAERDIRKKNKSVYYVNNFQDLKTCLNNLKFGSMSDAKKYIFTGSSYSNIKNILKKIVKI